MTELYSEKKDRYYNATVVMQYTGENYVTFKLEFPVVMGQKEWQKKECGKNIKKAGNVGITRDCEKKEKLIAILYGQGKKGTPI